VTAVPALAPAADYVSDLRAAVEGGAAALLAVSEQDAARRPAPGKWSPREIVGHLIDSAANNHQRFVRAQFQDDLVFPGYDQDAWVRAQDYQAAAWPALVELWRAYNLHLAHVMTSVPEEVRSRRRSRHNLHQIGWHTVPEHEPTSLDYLMRDYVAHLKHHLAEALPPGAPTGARFIDRPGADEYAPFYAGYVGRVVPGDLVAGLATQLAGTLELLGAVPEERGDYRYAPDKWSIKEVVGHLADTERIFAYRLLRIARGDVTPLAGFEQNDYVPAGAFHRRSLRGLTDDLRHVRQATVALVRSLDAAALARRGNASGAPVSARALVYIIAGHELHHVDVLRTRYLSGSPA
jgi:uncharacterized damage-inducible protein DinB